MYVHIVLAHLLKVHFTDSTYLQFRVIHVTLEYIFFIEVGNTYLYPLDTQRGPITVGRKQL